MNINTIYCYICIYISIEIYYIYIHTIYITCHILNNYIIYVTER